MSDHGHGMSSKEKAKLAEDEAVMKEMLPYFVYAAIPIFITILIAWAFGPTV